VTTLSVVVAVPITETAAVSCAPPSAQKGKDREYRCAQPEDQCSEDHDAVGSHAQSRTHSAVKDGLPVSLAAPQSAVALRTTPLQSIANFCASSPGTSPTDHGALGWC
jgi:hypothetical protein